SGAAPAPGVRTAPARPDSAPPPPSINAPPRPEAVAARCGRTDSMPDVAFGITRPLPRPTSVISPKKVQAVVRPAKVSASDSPVPAVQISAPQNTMRLIPTRTEYRPDR